MAQSGRNTVVQRTARQLIDTMLEGIHAARLNGLSCSLLGLSDKALEFKLICLSVLISAPCSRWDSKSHRELIQLAFWDGSHKEHGGETAGRNKCLCLERRNLKLES